MNGRQLTDAQISRALQAHLPERAAAGLRERVLDAAGTTSQQRPLPSFLGALTDADPVARRGSLLIAAVLLLGLVLASAAAAGALRLLERDPIRDLSLKPPADLQSSAVPSPTGAWIPTGSMGTPRSGHTAVRLLDGRVLVFGGADEDDTSAELYDPDSGTWSATGNMLKSHATAALLRDGRVLVFGDDFTPEVYDPASGTWTATRKRNWLHGERAMLLRDGKVLVLGEGESELYDPDGDSWTATRSSATPRHAFASVLLPDGKVLVAGGHVPFETPTDSAELYDPDTDSWTAIASMHAKREVIAAFLRPDGKVLVVGGSMRGEPQSAELYDPATGAWTPTGDVSRGGTDVGSSGARVFTALGDGTVLLARGYDGTDAELYDPGTGSWTPVPPTLRSQGTPILLRDGTVLVAGGSDCLNGLCVVTGSAELYVPRGVSPPPLPAFPSPPPPQPTPTPTPFPPAVGPIPPGARPWTVTVVNRSSNPATLFVAEMNDALGMGRLVGSVTPNVVPPGTTVKVTFLLPAKGVGGFIYVNAGQLLWGDDLPMAGEIRITASGYVDWLSP